MPSPPDPQRYGGVGVAKPCGDDVDRDSREQQRGRVQVAQIVQPSVGQRLGRGVAALSCSLISLVMSAVTVSLNDDGLNGLSWVLLQVLPYRRTYTHSSMAQAANARMHELNRSMPVIPAIWFGTKAQPNPARSATIPM
jgi:hypothetical protein